jgi:hypothetical protein
MPLMEVQSVGYGHGSSDWGRIPNSTRILVGTLGYSAEDVDGESAFDKCSAFDNDRVIAIEFNVDDMNPEYLPMIIDGVLAEGALDAYSQTIMGKKGRIGFLINVLLEEDNFDRIGRWLLANTTTAGFRYSCCLRKKLFRESKLIEVDGISVAVKRLFDQEKQILRCTIEADSLSEFCSKTGLSMTEAHNRIMAAARDAGW